VSIAAAPAVSAPTDDFAALYRETRDDLLAYVASLLRDPSAAEEVVAQVYERAYRRRRGWDARRGSPRAWLFGIARNAALDELRRRGRTARLVAEPAAGDAAPGEDEDERARRLAVRGALAGLEPRERDLVALRFHGGLSHREIARLLHVSESNAQTMLHRTLAKLREAVHA
jgi:RNA polymerase sigma-70 factor (ECF subfamily)